MPDADMYKVIQAGLYGAKEGEYIGKQIARDVAGPSVVKRWKWQLILVWEQEHPKKKW